MMKMQMALDIIYKHAECLPDGMFPSEVKDAILTIKNGTSYESLHGFCAGLECTWKRREVISIDIDETEPEFTGRKINEVVEQ